MCNSETDGSLAAVGSAAGRACSITYPRPEIGLLLIHPAIHPIRPARDIAAYALNRGAGGERSQRHKKYQFCHVSLRFS